MSPFKLLRISYRHEFTCTCAIICSRLQDQVALLVLTSAQDAMEDHVGYLLRSDTAFPDHISPPMEQKHLVFPMKYISTHLQAVLLMWERISGCTITEPYPRIKGFVAAATVVKPHLAPTLNLPEAQADSKQANCSFVFVISTNDVTSRLLGSVDGSALLV